MKTAHMVAMPDELSHLTATLIETAITMIDEYGAEGVTAYLRAIEVINKMPSSSSILLHPAMTKTKAN